ncbi:hypothetical protein Droror1_Dr00005663 [Drosera rotundifolia]
MSSPPAKRARSFSHGEGKRAYEGRRPVAVVGVAKAAGKRRRGDDWSSYKLRYVVTEFNAAQEVSGNLHKFFDGLPSIKTLNVRGFFLKYLPQHLPNALLQLQSLFLSINFKDLEENLAALCLLQSAPNLENLEILFEKLRSGCISGITNANQNWLSPNCCLCCDSQITN